MRDATSQALGLRRRLSARLRPLALAIGVLISLGLPVTYYVLQYNALRREAETSATVLAIRLSSALVAEAVVREFSQSVDAVAVRVQALPGKPGVPEFALVTPLAERWWNRLGPVGAAPVLGAGEIVGRAEVRLAQGTLIAITLGLLAMSTVTGVALAFLVYAVPVRVVGGMEQSVADLVDETTRRGERLRTVAELSRAVSGSLELTAVLREVVAAVAALRPALFCVVRLADQAAGGYRVAGSGGAYDHAVVPVLRFGEGLTHVVAESGQSLLVVDAPHDARTAGLDPQALREFPIYYGVPIQAGETLLGVLSVSFPGGAPPTADEREAIELYAGQAAVAIRNAQLFEQTERREREAEELARIARLLSESLDVAAVGGRIVESVLPLFDARSSGLYALEPDGSFRGIAWGGSARDRYTPGQSFPRGEGVIGWVATHNEPIANADVLGDSRFVFPEPRRSELAAGGNSAVLAVPLRAKGTLIGVLAVADKPGRAFSDAELALLQAFADQAALALENAGLYHRAQEAYAGLAEAQDRLVRGETLRAMGELASGVSHHLNNLLAVVLGRIQLALAKAPPPDVTRHLEIAERATRDGAEVIRRMRGFGQEPAGPVLETIDLNALAAEIVELTRPRWEDEAHMHGVTIATRLERGAIAPVRGESGPLREVLMNLVLNAVDAMPEGGHITLRTWAENGWVHCSVTDTGVGMSEEVRQRALEPFFTTKGVKSTGLGLSVNYGIIQRFGGELTIDSAEGRGTTVAFRLPAADQRAPTAAPPAAVAPPRRLRVLVIDDEPEVRSLLGEMLGAEGHDVVEAASGAEGLNTLGDGPGVDVVLTDLGMPGMTGWDLARAVKTRRPELPVVLLTGWGDNPAGRPEERAAVDLVIAKPVTAVSLRAALARAAATG
jgi:signal transduction histidine kinase/CheY-like chemotaxis protein